MTTKTPQSEFFATSKEGKVAPKTIEVQFSNASFFYPNEIDSSERTALSVRLDIRTQRQIDIIVQQLNGMGLEVETKSDFFKWTIYQGLEIIDKYFENKEISEFGLKQFLTEKKELAQFTEQQSRINSVLANVDRMIRSFALAFQYGDFREIANKVDDWIKKCQKFKKSNSLYYRALVIETHTHYVYVDIMTEFKTQGLYSKTMKDYYKIFVEMDKENTELNVASVNADMKQRMRNAANSR